MNKLIGEIADAHPGPILVIGGAPTVPEELLTLEKGGFPFEEATIISANEHACYTAYKPHYCVVNDDVHTRLHEKQEPRMRELLPGVPLISRHWWADIRTDGNIVVVNSGFKAIAVASVLGGNPIVAVGMGCYRDGLYFHRREGENSNLHRDTSYFITQAKKVKDFVQHAPVRVVDGPLGVIFGRWNPDEKFEPRTPTGHAVVCREALELRRVAHFKSETHWEGSITPAGWIMAVTERELRPYRLNEEIEDLTDWQCEDYAAEIERRKEQALAEERRIAAKVQQVRGGRRSISSRFDESDLRRYIRRLEAGYPLAGIAREAGIPVNQLKYIAQRLDIPFTT